MAEIRIEAKPVIGGATGQGHLYLVYENDDGQEYVIRGGPQYDNPLNFGDIEIQANILLSDSEDARLISERSLYGSTVVDLGGELCPKVGDGVIMRHFEVA